MRQIVFEASCAFMLLYVLSSFSGSAFFGNTGKHHGKKKTM